MKRLISVDDVQALNKKGEREIPVDSNTIITPSARDLASDCGMKFVENSGCNTSSPSCTGAGCEAGLSSDVIYDAMSKMVSQGMFKGMFDETTSCCGGECKPYKYEKDPSGFKVIRGNTVGYEVLETGNPADNGRVKYQELIGAEDKSSVNSGFMTINSCTFDWDVEVEEIYYIVEGRLGVEIDGRKYFAERGDSLFIQKGSKVVFSAVDSVKVFYATY